MDLTSPRMQKPRRHQDDMKHVWLWNLQDAATIDWILGWSDKSKLQLAFKLAQ